MNHHQERRSARRRCGVEEHGVLTTRISPGHHARLVDVSSDGALVDTPLRLLPGTRIDVRLATRHQRINVRGEVVRCAVARLRPVVYRGAIRFEERLACFADVDGCDLPTAAATGTADVRAEATHGAC